jgi:hypothetical protein
MATVTQTKAGTQTNCNGLLMHATKRFGSKLKADTTLLAIALTLTVAGTAVAQTTVSNAPVITVVATDARATWLGDTGTFTIFRGGNPTNPVIVFYAISGTASNGVDYAPIASTVSIPGGVTCTSVVIKPINLGQTDIRSVNLGILASPLANPLTDYRIGFPRSATLYITPDLTNPPPALAVRITSPPNGAIFRGPLDLPIYAFARATSGPVALVEFFENGTSLGLGRAAAATTAPPGVSNLFGLIWSNAPAGKYALRATATDTHGNTALSDAVNISILESGPPFTNRPPIVSILATDPVAIEGTNCWSWRGLAGGPITWSNWLGSSSVWRFFTNCGPKNAIFTIRRIGDTNDSVTVDYRIGGTASNGVDYVALPGSVTIPAGQRTTLITVVPIDDGPPDITSTVILKLEPSATTNYVLGLPRGAGAIIVDGPATHSGPTMLAGNTFHLSMTGPDSAWFHIESSADLVNWAPICTNQVINGSIDFVDPDSSITDSRFYRAVPELNPAPF